MRKPYYTIGHSNRSLEEFAGLLTQNGIQLVADIRTVPRSRTNPQFNKDVMAANLAPYGIAYEHIAALGGLRGVAKTVSGGVNGLWKNKSFHNYADYALTPQFHAGLEELIVAGQERLTAMMCAEAVWWRCHRRIVSDYLIARGGTVYHILGPDHVGQASLTPGAFIEPDRDVVYPSPDGQQELFDGR